MDTSHNTLAYPRFLLRMLVLSFEGSWRFYAWMTLLTAVALVGANAWAQQMAQGMVLTNMTDHVSWGLYIANFTFGVGLAAGAVMMVIPAYLYEDREMHDVVVIGEVLAVAAIVGCLLFVTVDLGRPDRFWHLIPGIGRFNWPMSMLTWDVIVLNIYLLLNLHITGYLVYTRYLGRRPARAWYVPFVLVSIVWAMSIHTVTAFLYCGLGGRPFWNSALLAPRFLASAFVSGPALVILLLQVVRRAGSFHVGDGPLRTLTRILRVTTPINLFMLCSELFTAFYTGGAHAEAAHYLFFGDHGRAALVPWIWSAVGLNSLALLLLYLPRTRHDLRWLDVACVAAFIGVWIEKGLGLITPGFVPSTLHELVEYLPSLTEWKITAGVWALCLMILTVGLRLALPVLTGEVRSSARLQRGSSRSNPVAPFQHDHVLIARVLSSFERYLEVLQRDKRPSPTELLKFVTFFGEFVHFGHHVKEEEILLAAVRAATDSQVCAKICREHREERSLLAGLRRWTIREEWDEDEVQRLIADGRHFAQFLGNHMALEESVLFPLVVARLDESSSDRVLSQVNEFDARRASKGHDAWLPELGERLAAG